MMPIRRRSFLQLAASSAALAAVPTLLLPSKARAATAAFGAVRHVLVLHAQGGFRSPCTFNAVGAFQHNPFGTQAAAQGTEWTLGAACGRVSYETSLGTVAPFSDVTNEVAVLACVDPNPEGPAEIDHSQGHRRVATGSPTGANGLLTLVGAHHPLYAGGFARGVLPPVEIGPTDFGLGAGPLASRRPLTMIAGGAGISGVLGVSDGWHTGIRQHLDTALLARRSRTYTKRLRNWMTAKDNAALFATALQAPLFDLRNQPTATDAGVTNAQLLEVLGDHDLAMLGDPMSSPSWGSDVAIALRCFSAGSPMAVVTRAIYDMHDLEKLAYGPRTQDLVRQLAGLRFLLPRMPHPEGGTYWDHTLVVTLSEFARNNTSKETGFNSGAGSDHVTEGAAPARHQAIAVMGGVVTAKGKQIGATDEELEAVGPVLDQRAVLSTLLDVLGIDGTAALGVAPIGELFS